LEKLILELLDLEDVDGENLLGVSGDLELREPQTI
jgi:hypothetical protein